MPRPHRYAIVFFGLLGAEVHAEKPASWLVRADTAYRNQDFATAATFYENAIAAGERVAVPAYNAACCCARLGRIDDAFAWIDRAIGSGWRDVERLKSDPDFASLHADDRWNGAIQRCQKRLDKYLGSLSEPVLRKELLKRAAEDQRIRLTPNPNIFEWWKIDADNTKFMKRVIEQHGWPGRSMVGADGALAAFLMVQHADADAVFQKKCLDLMRVAVQKNEASPQNLAYLTDRVLVAEGKPQRYGTQFHTVNGEPVPLPIEDEANVDSRRNQVGLPPLSEYAQQMRERERR